MEEDIYGSSLYYFIDEKAKENGVISIDKRLDQILDVFEKEELAIILNRFDSIYPKKMFDVSSGAVDLIDTEYG